MTTKFFGQLAGRFAGTDQFNHLLAKLRRTRRFGVAVVTPLDSFLA